jgi:hypothetical protein
MIPLKQIVLPHSPVRWNFPQLFVGNPGLNKPVVVVQREKKSGETRYLLTCGRARVEALCLLGQSKIPAIVIQGERDVYGAGSSRQG